MIAIYKKRLLSLLLLLGCYAAANAQPAPWCPAILRDSLYSNTLKEERPITIILPDKYKPGGPEKYDVLYVLDGDWNTKLAFDVTRFVESAGFIPPVIIVSIPNIIVPNGENLRGRDYTPTHLDSWPGSGGADRFLAFLKNELIPYVNKTYPSDGKNILWGTSLGGLLAVYAFLADPSPFESFIANDPSLWYDNNYLHKLAAKKADFLKNLSKTLWINGREGKGLVEMGIAGFDSLLPPEGSSALHWKLVAYPFETHLSEIFKGCYDGIKFSYTGYQPGKLEFHPMNGILLKDKPFKLHGFDSPWQTIGYTTDGSEPTLQSARINDSTSVSGPADFTAKAFCYRPDLDKTARGKFVLGEPLKAGPKPRKATPGGLGYTYYPPEDWDRLAPAGRSKPLQSGTTQKDFLIDTLKSPAPSVSLLDGWLEIREEGYYLFVVEPREKINLWLGNQLLIGHTEHPSGPAPLTGATAPAPQGSPKYESHYLSFVLPLSKGFYRFRQEALLQKGETLPHPIYLKPGPGRDGPEPLAPEVLYK